MEPYISLHVVGEDIAMDNALLRLYYGSLSSKRAMQVVRITTSREATVHIRSCIRHCIWYCRQCRLGLLRLIYAKLDRLERVLRRVVLQLRVVSWRHCIRSMIHLLLASLRGIHYIIRAIINLFVRHFLWHVVVVISAPLLNIESSNIGRLVIL